MISQYKKKNIYDLSLSSAMNYWLLVRTVSPSLVHSLSWNLHI